MTRPRFLKACALMFVMTLSSHGAFAAAPCCAVVSVDLKTGVVTAVVSATHRSFTFQVPSRTELRTIAVGQSVFADFHTGQVSLDGDRSCCAILAAPKP